MVVFFHVADVGAVVFPCHRKAFRNRVVTRVIVVLVFNVAGGEEVQPLHEGHRRPAYRHVRS